MKLTKLKLRQIIENTLNERSGGENLRLERARADAEVKMLEQLNAGKIPHGNKYLASYMSNTGDEIVFGLNVPEFQGYPAAMSQETANLLSDRLNELGGFFGSNFEVRSGMEARGDTELYAVVAKYYFKILNN